MGFRFRRAKEAEAETVYAMIAYRVQWMEENGIHQWNETDYLHTYPLSYFRKNTDKLYVLTDENDRILCAAVLFEQDRRWQRTESAYYIHHLVTGGECPGIGKEFLRCAEDYARRMGKEYLRLDSAVGNERLGRYYEALGFTVCGSCTDGPYRGILREKRLP